jgi:ADP-heptose:LPS heptosyltransferase/GT2 family glycosyltransferase
VPDRADFHLDGPFDQNTRLTYFGERLNLSGWAILPDSSYRLAVYADDFLLGCVTPAEQRADLLRAFPWLAENATPGFNTTVALPRRLLEANPDRQLRIVLESNGEIVKESFWRVAKGVPRLEFNIDETKIIDGRLACDQRNMRFYGWAVCQEKIDGITADLGDHTRIVAQYGITRPDVFAVRPNAPNGSAAGFSLFIPIMPPHCETIVFSILLSGGTVLTRQYALAIQPDTVPLPSFRRLSFAENHFLTGLLPDRVSQPCFVILPADGGLADSISTIRRIATQLVQPVILIHADCEGIPADACVFRSGRELSALLQAQSGEWILCLRAGDTVSPGLGLFLHGPDPSDKAFIYWDETSATENRVRTVFKVPGAPFITLLHQNFIGRGWAVRVTDGLRASLAGRDVADHMISMPLAAFRTPAACTHIPEILSRHIYERDESNLSAADIAVRNQVLTATESVYGRLSFVAAGQGAGKLELTCNEEGLPRISVIIPTIGTAGRVMTCLRGLREQTDYQNLEIIVVDHMKFAPEFLALKREIREYADQVLPMIGPFNWSTFNNVGAALATGDVLLFLNDDVEVADPQWLRCLLPYLSLVFMGAVGPRLLTPDGSVQSCGISVFDGKGSARNDFAFTGADVAIGDGINLVPHNCTSLLGAAILTRRETYSAFGGFEEALPLTFNDLDYHMKLRSVDRQVAVITTASLTHFEKTSRALIEEKTLETVYDARWRRQHLLGDPYIHPACETESGMYKIHREPGETVWSRNIAAARSDIRKILVMRLDHIGDFTVTIPAFRLLRETFPQARIDIVVGPWNVAIADRLKLFDSVKAFNFYNERSGDGRELDETASRAQFRERVAGETYDLAIDMRLDGDTRLLLTLAESVFRAGFSHGLLHPWLDISVEWAGNLRSWRKTTSVADEMRRLIMTVGDRFPAEPSLNENHWTPQAASSAQTLPVVAAARQRHVVIHPFAGNEIKMWPAEKWRDLVSLLHADGVGITMVGSANDAIREAETAAALVRAGAVNALGKHSINDLVSFIATADCFVGCDSGPKHLAASAGIPVVGLQSGFVDPVMWGPMNVSGISLIRKVNCAPCYLDDAAKCPRQVDCMTQIAVADVYRQICLVLGAAETAQEVPQGRLADTVQPAKLAG